MFSGIYPVSGAHADGKNVDELKISRSRTFWRLRSGAGRLGAGRFAEDQKTLKVIVFRTILACAYCARTLRN